MQFITKNFGTIEYEDEAVITFADSLLGFYDLTRFIIIPADETDEADLFCWMQSVEDGDIAFVLMNVYQVIPDYNPLVEPEMIEDLGEHENMLEIFNIAVIPEEIKKIRVNLKAPVVINPLTRKARQVVVNNEEYSVRHHIFEEIERAQQSGTGR